GCLTAVALYGGFTGWLSDAIVIPALAICSYGMFTVMHEAVHGSILNRRPATRVSRAITRLIGGITSVWMGPSASYTAYRHLHLAHHRCTNDRDHDPDVYNGVGPWWWRPLSWLTTDFYYFYFYLTRASSRPLHERLAVLCESLSFLGAFIVLCVCGFTYEALAYWF